MPKSKSYSARHRARAFAFWMAIFFPILSLASPRQLDDHGTFTIFQGGKHAGSESFSIHTSDGKVDAKAETQLSVTGNGKQLEFRTSSDLILDPDLQPQTYTWKQRGARSSSLEINFRSSPATADYRTLDGKRDVRQFDLPKDVAVLDDNVLIHYEILVERCDRSSEGKQTFTAFIPQEALPGQLSIERMNEAAIEIDGKKLKARHFHVTTDLAQIDLWADKQGHIQRISIPAAQLEADRQ